MASEDLSPSTRVILWFHPRSRSTALEMAIASDENTKVFHEEFYYAYYLGEERQCHEKLAARLQAPIQGYRYSDIKAKLEKSFPGKTAVFVKDGASALVGRDHYKYIPRDSEDLANSPRETLQRYCLATGITFKESFLNWKPGNTGHLLESMKDNPEYMKAYHDTAVRSSTFHRSSDENIDLSELPEELQKWSETFMPLYEEIIRHKL
ncbi:uncharacterized protein LOC144439971 [Glandiceps talaboti]